MNDDILGFPRRLWHLLYTVVFGITGVMGAVYDTTQTDWRSDMGFGLVIGSAFLFLAHGKTVITGLSSVVKGFQPGDAVMAIISLLVAAPSALYFYFLNHTTTGPVALVSLGMVLATGATVVGTVAEFGTAIHGILNKGRPEQRSSSRGIEKMNKGRQAAGNRP